MNLVKLLYTYCIYLFFFMVVFDSNVILISIKTCSLNKIYIAGIYTLTLYNNVSFRLLYARIKCIFDISVFLQTNFHAINKHILMYNHFWWMKLLQMCIKYFNYFGNFPTNINLLNFHGFSTIFPIKYQQWCKKLQIL